MEKLLSELKEAFEAVSPYIESHTSKVCPECQKVCCIDRHGRYEEKDLIFINALGISGTDDVYERSETEPCRFLAKGGCSRPRFLRPFRCTWYFCEGLLDSMNSDRPKDYRKFISALQHLHAVRQEFMGLKEH